MYSRWTRYNCKTDIPQDARCHCLVAKTGEPCLIKPTYFIHATDTWACGRHLQKSLPECSICMCEMSKKSEKRLACGHVFHEKCLSTWEDTTKEPRCPMCRTAYFASGWHPMSLPTEVEIGYQGYDCSEHNRIMIHSVMMEFVRYHYITEPTVRELVCMFGSEWYTCFTFAPVFKDGTVGWSQMDYTHRTVRMLRRLEDKIYSDIDSSFFVSQPQQLDVWVHKRWCGWCMMGHYDYV